MYFSPDQYASASKAFLESQLAALAAMTAITTRSTERIFALNLAAAKASTEGSIVAARELMALKDPQAFFMRASALAKSRCERLAVYNGHLADVGTLAKAEFAKITEAHVNDTQNKVIAIFNSFGRHADPVRKT
jgi:phasin family protein